MGSSTSSAQAPIRMSLAVPNSAAVALKRDSVDVVMGKEDATTTTDSTSERSSEEEVVESAGEQVENSDNQAEEGEKGEDEVNKPAEVEIEEEKAENVEDTETVEEAGNAEETQKEGEEEDVKLIHNRIFCFANMVIFAVLFVVCVLKRGAESSGIFQSTTQDNNDTKNNSATEENLNPNRFVSLLPLLVDFWLAHILADMHSGFYHWLADSYQTENEKLNDLLLEDFQQHHAFPYAMTLRGVETNCVEIFFCANVVFGFQIIYCAILRNVCWVLENGFLFGEGLESPSGNLSNPMLSHLRHGRAGSGIVVWISSVVSSSILGSSSLFNVVLSGVTYVESCFLNKVTSIVGDDSSSGGPYFSPSNFILFYVFWAAMIQVVHRWNHTLPNKTPYIYRILSALRLIQTRKSHNLHHKKPELKNYCILGELCNPVFEFFDVWNWVESKVIFPLFGLVSFRMILRDPLAYRNHPFWLKDDARKEFMKVLKARGVVTKDQTGWVRGGNEKSRGIGKRGKGECAEEK